MLPYLALTIDLAIIGIIYFISGAAYSLIIEYILPDFDPKHYPTRMFIETLLTVAVIYIGYHFIRYFIINTSFPFENYLKTIHGVEGFHLKDGEVISSFAMYLFLINFRKKVEYIQHRWFHV